MGDETCPTVVKRWDREKGWMTLLVRNGSSPSAGLAVEDSYPESLAGILCFARSGNVSPAATAAAGKINWQLAGLRPGEVRELIYTALAPAVLHDPAAPKRPSPQDHALLEAAKGLPARLLVDDSGSQEASAMPAEPEPAPLPPLEPETAAAPAAPREGPGKVISIGAGKGGTGKTTFSINFAIALADLGFDTVLIDADASMSTLAPYLGIDVQSLKATLHEVLAGEAEPEKAVYRAFGDRLRIVPSGLSIAGFLKMDRGLLAAVIGHFSAGADFVVIDTPAGYNREVALALKASDALVLVLNPDEGSMIDGLKVQEMARILGVNVQGIVLNRHDMKGYQYSKAQVEAYFGTPVVAMLPEDANARRKDHVPLVIASPGSRAAQEVVKVARLASGREASAPVQKPFASRLMEALFRA